MSTELRVPQCLPSLQWSPSTVQNSVVTEYSTEHSVYRVQYSIQYSPSHQTGTVFAEEQCLPSESLLPSLQWSPSSELLKAVSMNRVFTFTECMTMPGNVVDTVYQMITELVQ